MLNADQLHALDLFSKGTGGTCRARLLGNDRGAAMRRTIMRHLTGRDLPRGDCTVVCLRAELFVLFKLRGSVAERERLLKE